MTEKERRRAYYERNREHIIAKAVEWGRANPERRRAHGRANYRRHREEKREKLAAWRKANPDKVREQNQRRRSKNHASHVRRTFGLGPGEYEAMLAAQGGVCAICGRPETRKDKAGRVKPLAVDHCHESDKVRGLLCDACNQGLGHFGDDVTRMQEAIAYLGRA